MEEHVDGEEQNQKEEAEYQSQRVWSWGAGTDGQLGTGKLQDELLPQLLHLPFLSSAQHISMLACGGAHVLALTSCGRVFSWGRGTSGQLGHGEMVSSIHPNPVISLETLCITQVSAGWSHSGFVSDSGSLFTCGDGSFGQLGHGDYESRTTPDKVSYFADNHVAQIACGMRHSLVLLRDYSRNQVYGFGCGKRGQLGISSDKARLVSLPQATRGFEDIRVASISANGDHSAALSCDGEVYMLGGSHHGALNDLDKFHPGKLVGSGSTGAVLDRVSGLDDVKVSQIAAGAEHSAIVTGKICMDGAVKTWGWGEHGQLGLGNTNDQTGPQVVTLCQEVQNEEAILKIYCGSGFTYAVRSEFLINSDNVTI
ncbi:hypothetical protein Tsubulata_042381 [Turnera subulata]|uniref:RCC1-like domain-containing protein n=1 Tax=Turnera subulata TaxID=218843 RepID=A0A9Q0F286_9ROSI|nr:hypothetical protein Tsubulata_042381 [Turnera subulata]